MNPMIFEFNVPNTFARINIDSNHGAKCKFLLLEINKSKWSSLSGYQLPCGRFGKLYYGQYEFTDRVRSIGSGFPTEDS